MRFDASSLATANAHSLASMLLLLTLGVLLLAMIAAAVMRNRVLAPVLAIKQAVEHRRRGFGGLAMPELGNDELGELARLLDRSLSELEQLDDRLRLLSQAIQGSSSEVYIVDAQSLGVVFANRAAEHNLGYSQKELLSMRVPDVVPAMREPAYVADLGRRLRERHELRHRYEQVRRDGEHYPFEFTAIYALQHGRPRIIVIGNDISEREAQEAALRASEERLNLAVEGSNDGIFDYDVQGNGLYLSDRVRDWLAVPMLEDARASLAVMLERVHGKDRARVRSELVECLRSGRAFDVEFRYQTPDDPARWLQLRGRGTGGDGDKPDRIIGFRLGHQPAQGRREPAARFCFPARCGAGQHR